MNLSAHVRIPENLTDYGKRQYALMMRYRGESFVLSAMLLKQNGGDAYVWRHLLCQGIEILLKSVLLMHNFDKYHGQLRKKYGHDLVKLVRATSKLANVKVPRGELATEFSQLSQMYAAHRLRYEDGFGLLVDGNTIPSERVVLRTIAMLRLLRRRDRELASGA